MLLLFFSCAILQAGAGVGDDDELQAILAKEVGSIFWDGIATTPNPISFFFSYTFFFLLLLSFKKGRYN